MYENYNNQKNGKTQVKILAYTDISVLEKEVNDFIDFCNRCRYQVISVEMNEINQNGSNIPCCLVHYSVDVSENTRTCSQEMTEGQMYDSLRIEQSKQRAKKQSHYGDDKCSWENLF